MRPLKLDVAKLWAFILIALFGLTFFFSPKLRAQENNIVGLEGASGGSILFAAPFSGPLSDFGQEAKNGAELALKTWGGLKMDLLDENGSALNYEALGQAQVVVGYFFESRLVADSPLYLFVKKPVILPFSTNPKATEIGPNYFSMMPTDAEQGRILALKALSLKKRPKKIIALYGPETPGQLLVKNFIETLRTPPPPPAPVKGQKKQTPLKPLDKNALLIEKQINKFSDLEAMALDFKAPPDLLILALSPDMTLEIAPWLKNNFNNKSNFWLPSFLAIREVGVALNEQGLTFNVLLPLDVSDAKNKKMAEFKEQYLDIYHKYPSWLAALSYDAVGLAIKAVSSGGAVNYLSVPGQHYQNLGRYESLKPGHNVWDVGVFMPVNVNTQMYLP